MKNNKDISILFDVDGTLITFDDEPRWEIINLLKTLHSLGVKIIVASGGGKDYAAMWVRRLFLEKYVDEIEDKILLKNAGRRFDITLDDEFSNLGSIHIRV